MPTTPPVRLGRNMLHALQLIEAEGGRTAPVRAGKIMRQVSRDTRNRNGSAVVRRCWQAGLIALVTPDRGGPGPNSLVVLSLRGVDELAVRRG